MCVLPGGVYTLREGDQSSVFAAFVAVGISYSPPSFKVEQCPRSPSGDKYGKVQIIVQDFTRYLSWRSGFERNRFVIRNKKGRSERDLILLIHLMI